MAITIEGYSIVVKRDRIELLIARGAIAMPNTRVVADDHLWRCGFMAEADADAFAESIERAGLNASAGPDPDAVLVSEFDRLIRPYCEWIKLGPWEKAVIAWMSGTTPTTVVAPEGWDPKVGSGPTFVDRRTLEGLEFRRLDGLVEVYFDKLRGREVYIGRTTTPVEAMYESATQAISAHFVTAGEPAVHGDVAEQIAEAVASLEKVTSLRPDWWQAHWYLGKGRVALGRHASAYGSLRRAFELEDGVEAVSRELAGVCLELGRFDEAVTTLQRSASLAPDDPAVLGNLALAFLLAHQTDEAAKALAAAEKMKADDPINHRIRQIIDELAAGRRDPPRSLADLAKPARRARRPFWKLW